MKKDDKNTNIDYLSSILDTLPSAVKTELLDILAEIIAHDILNKQNAKQEIKTDA